MVGIVCCKVVTVYRNGNIDMMFIDIETGRQVVLYSENQSHDENMAFFIEHIKCGASNCYPSTFVFLGQWDYVEDFLIFDMSSKYVSGFMKDKMYACYMQKDSKSPFGARFIDRITNKEIKLINSCAEHVIDTRSFTDNVFNSGYRGFGKLGEDSVIIGGLVSGYGNNITIDCNENLIMGVVEMVYDRLAHDMIG